MRLWLAASLAAGNFLVIKLFVENLNLVWHYAFVLSYFVNSTLHSRIMAEDCVEISQDCLLTWFSF